MSVQFSYVAQYALQGSKGIMAIVASVWEGSE